MNDDRLALLCPLVVGAPIVQQVRLSSCAALPLDPQGPVDVHVVLRGTARCAGTMLSAGDVLIVRGAAVERGGAANDGGAESLRARYERARFATQPSHVEPAVVHVSAAEVARDPHTSSLVALLRDVGPSALGERLFDALFVAIEQSRFARLASSGETATTSRPFPLADARIARTITQLHARHDERWTIASMAKHAAMSRAAFARRFAELTGVPPHAYLERLRVDVARVLLREGDAPIADIAVRAGYRSESVFSRAFKRIAGEPPAVFRRTARATAQAAA